MVWKEIAKFYVFWVKNGKNQFLPHKTPINPRSHSPIMLVRELVRINVGLHVYTKFHQNRIIFARVIVLTDTRIYIYEFERMVFLASRDLKTKKSRSRVQVLP